MSTKSSLANGPNFHLYHDMLVEDHVCLEIEGAQFEASYGRVMVPIPVHVWEVIRRYPGVDLQLADKTDAELRQYAEQMLDDRLKRHHQSAENTKPIMALSGALVFGGIDEPREVQLATGLDHYTRLREHQRQIQRAGGENLTVAGDGIKADVWQCFPRPLFTFVPGAAARRSARTATPRTEHKGPSAWNAGARSSCSHKGRVTTRSSRIR